MGHDPKLLGYFSEVTETLRDEPPGFQAMVGLQAAMIVARTRSLRQCLLEAESSTDEKMVRHAISAMLGFDTA